MKNLILFYIFFTVSCTAQSPVLPLYSNPEYGDIEGAYFKDINNDFDNFTGTWEYLTGNTSLRIVLQERQQYPLTNYYSDFIVGEWRYIENGIEIVNTLSDISDDTNGIFMHSIVGNIILGKNAVPKCLECNFNERRLNLIFNDPTRSTIQGLRGEVVMRIFNENGVAKMKLSLRQSGNITYIEGSPPQYTTLSIPWGEYILTKVL